MRRQQKNAACICALRFRIYGQIQFYDDLTAVSSFNPKYQGHSFPSQLSGNVNPTLGIIHNDIYFLHNFTDTSVQDPISSVSVILLNFISGQAGYRHNLLQRNV